NCPSSATEEIVETVERMSLFPGKGRIGLDGLEHSELGSLAQAHHPTDQHLDVCPERWFGECGQQALQNGVERGYARKHGRGPPCPLRASCDAGKPRKVYKEPRPLFIIKFRQKICERSEIASPFIIRAGDFQ